MKKPLDRRDFLKSSLLVTPPLLASTPLIASAQFVPFGFQKSSTSSAPTFDFGFASSSAAVDSPTSTSTITFSSMNIGAADTHRRVVVAVAASNYTSTTPPVAISGVTVAGIAATKVAEQISAYLSVAQIWIADVPSGTTGTVVLTKGGAHRIFCGIGLYRAVMATSTPHHTNGVMTGTPSGVSSSQTLSVNTVSGGAVIGITNKGLYSGANTYTNVSENFSTWVGTNFNAVGMSTTSTSAGSLSVTHSYGFARDVAMIVASFG